MSKKIDCKSSRKLDQIRKGSVLTPELLALPTTKGWEYACTLGVTSWDTTVYEDGRYGVMLVEEEHDVDTGDGYHFFPLGKVANYSGDWIYKRV